MKSLQDKDREIGIYRVTIIGSLVNAMLVVVKILAGFIANSAAIIADGIHSLSDFLTDIIVVIFIRISNKPQNESYDYGHGKFETLATLLISVILLFVGIGIAWDGGATILSVINGHTLESPGVFALVAALISIVSKELLYYYTIYHGKRLHSDAVVANAWHHRSDAFSSIATAIGIAGAIFLGDKWTILDPLAALFVSFFIIKTAVNLAKPCLDELLEKSLPKEVEDEIELIVYSFDGVSGLHHLRTRKIGRYYAIEFHIRMDGRTSLDDTHYAITQIESKLKGHYGKGTHVIIHMEPLKKPCEKDS